MTQPIEHKKFEPIYTFHISNNGLGQLGHLWGNKPPVALIFPKIWHQKNPLGKYRIASNKRRGRSFNFWHFFWGGAGGGAFIQGRRLHEGGVYYKIQKKLQFYISTSMISSSSSIRKPKLSASSTSGICDQIERVRTIRFG